MYRKRKIWTKKSPRFGGPGIGVQTADVAILPVIGKYATSRANSYCLRVALFTTQEFILYQ
ncbi:hypothetical protein CSC12_0923 [Klebsiella michiganensis]|nr:hypothetical protein CSC12_0923 [Klebsiella michiganensis]